MKCEELDVKSEELESQKEKCEEVSGEELSDIIFIKWTLACLGYIIIPY